MKWNQIEVESGKVATAVDLARAIVSTTNVDGADDITIKDATKVIKGIRDGILALVASGYREVKIGNIGILKIATFDEHEAKNPKTGEKIIVPTKLRAIGKFSKTLKVMVSELPVDIGNDVIVQINEEKAERSKKAKEAYAKRAANGKTFKTKK